MTDEFDPHAPGPPREVHEDAAAREWMTAEDRASEISTQIVTDVSELADRTSPDDRPWELTVTADELALIAERAAITALRKAHTAGKTEGAAEEREKIDEWRGEVRYIRWDVHERSVEQEREACARIADQEASTIGDDGYEGEVWVAMKIAAAIRAREGGDSDG